jgi:hypothetical protein
VTHPIFETIRDEVDRLMRRLRTGFYVGEVSHPEQSYRRVQIVPEWIGDGAVDRFRRIASPVLDIIPAAGSRMAVLSQDGMPELGAIIGQIWDDLAEPMTVWLRANLAQSPGHLELGAAKGLRIRVGSNGADESAAFAMNETAEGEIVIESDDGSCSVALKPGGDVVLSVAGGSTVQLGGTVELPRDDHLQSELAGIKAALDTIASAASTTHTYTVGDTACDKVRGE